jgi:hypothetical protein
MTDAEMKGVLLGIVLATAENIYISKCMFYNVPALSDSDKEKCIHEAVEVLPEVLEYYKQVCKVKD